VLPPVSLKALGAVTKRSAKAMVIVRNHSTSMQKMSTKCRGILLFMSH